MRAQLLMLAVLAALCSLTAQTLGQMSPEEAMKILRENEAKTDTANEDKSTTSEPSSSDKEPQPTPLSGLIRIGSWNIEWLGTPDNRRGPAAGQAQTVKDLADYIVSAKLDILAVQEVAATMDDQMMPREERPDTFTSPILDQVFEMVAKANGGDWKHVLFPTYGSRLGQLTGLAWNTERVQAVGEPVDIHRVAAKADENGEQAQLWSQWVRPPHGIMFTAGDGLTDFVVIPIHMKAGAGDNSERRRGEAEELVADLPHAFQDGDILIIGDSNCSNTNEPAIKVLGEAGFVDLNQRDTATYWTGVAPLDRAFVPADQPEFKKRSFAVWGKPYMARRRMEPADFARRLSDHMMVITSITVMADDD